MLKLELPTNAGVTTLHIQAIGIVDWKRKKEDKDWNYCTGQCVAVLILLCFIGWGIMFYYSLFYYSDYEEMPAGVIAAISICGLFGAVSCACCVRCNVKQRAWRKKLRRERWAKENGPSSTDSSL